MRDLFIKIYQPMDVSCEFTHLIHQVLLYMWDESEVELNKYIFNQVQLSSSICSTTIKL
mgnify:CR=1 FL=1